MPPNLLPRHLPPLRPRPRPRPRHSAHTPASNRTLHTTPPLAADMLKRPHRPYTFTQLITLSDGSTFTHRTTSPVPIYHAIKDTRNTLLWQPNDKRLAAVEEDEAGRLRAFRRRFGRSFDAEGVDDIPASEAEAEAEGEGEGEAGADAAERGAESRLPGADDTAAAAAAPPAAPAADEGVSVGAAGAEEWTDEAADNLMDLIGSYGKDAPGLRGDAPGLRGDVRMAKAGFGWGSKGKGKGKGKGKKG